MTLKIISQYRQELMGLAMLMVVYHHMPIREFTLVDSYMHLNGVFGVDISFCSQAWDYITQHGKASTSYIITAGDSYASSLSTSPSLGYSRFWQETRS